MTIKRCLVLNGVESLYEQTIDLFWVICCTLKRRSEGGLRRASVHTAEKQKKAAAGQPSMVYILSGSEVNENAGDVAVA